MAETIVKNYDKYDGFVVLHGTDTMAYSASALSFMLENLAKPVIFTGSQLPIGLLRTDGRENLLTAIEIAAAKGKERLWFPRYAFISITSLPGVTGQPNTALNILMLSTRQIILRLLK